MTVTKEYRGRAFEELPALDDDERLPTEHETRMLLALSAKRMADALEGIEEMLAKIHKAMSP